MSADENHRSRERRWTQAQLVGLIAVVWMLSILLFFILTVNP